jgi:hypothetical protein
MEHLIPIVLFSAALAAAPALAEASGPAQSDAVTELETVADYIAELERMGTECQAKLNTGTGADRMWRVCASVCQRAAQELSDWQGDPERALSHAQKRMVKCSNNYNAGIDYEKRVKR